MSGNFLLKKRTVAEKTARDIFQKQTDIIGIMLVCSVAVGDARDDSDVDLLVVTGKKTGFAKRIYKNNIVDIGYFPLNSIVQSLNDPLEGDFHGWKIAAGEILYDAKGILREIKTGLKKFPLEKRRKKFNYHFNSSKEYLQKCHVSLRNKNSAKAINDLYVSALRFWCCLYPLNKTYRRDNFPVMSESASFSLKPPSFEKKFSKVIGLAENEQELGKRMRLMGKFLEEMKGMPFAPRAAKDLSAEQAGKRVQFNAFLKKKQAVARRALNEIMKKEKDIVGAMLVCSVATGEAKHGSDVDLTVFTKDRKDTVNVDMDNTEVDINYTPWGTLRFILADPLWYDQSAWVYAGGIILYDPGKKLAGLKHNLQTYPMKLRKKVFTSHFMYSRAYLNSAKKLKEQGALARANAFLCLSAIFSWCALFPLNGAYRKEWLPNIKAADTFTRKPRHFQEHLSIIMGFPINEKEMLQRAGIISEFTRWIEKNRQAASLMRH